MPPLADIHAALSSPRLAAYRAPGEDDRVALARYVWNLQLCEAFYPAFHLLEVSLRNSLDAAITARSGTDHWYTPEAAILDAAEAREVEKVRAQLRGTHGGREPHPGQVVAGLMFGFWTSLFKRSYEHQQRLWPHILRDVLPGMPRTSRKRSVAAGRFHDLRQARNRIFHHEPIWNRDPARLRLELFEAITWVSPASRALVDQIDRSGTLVTFDQASMLNLVDKSLQTD
jgi:hypothetical protein